VSIKDCTLRVSNETTKLFLLRVTIKAIFILLTPPPLFPTYPRTVCGPRAIAAPLLHTDQMNRAHSPEEAPRSFTMAPCAVAERLEGKQQCSRAAASEHAGIQAQE